MEGVRERRLEALLLQALGQERTLEELHAALKPLHPGLTKARLFALLVRLKLEGKVACLLYTSPSPRDRTRSRMPSSA